MGQRARRFVVPGMLTLHPSLDVRDFAAAELVPVADELVAKRQQEPVFVDGRNRILFPEGVLVWQAARFCGGKIWIEKYEHRRAM